MSVGRTSLVGVALAASSLTGCASEHAAAPPSWSAAGLVLVGACDVQVGSAEIGGISGLAWSGEGDGWIGVSDVKGPACMIGLRIETEGPGPVSARAVSVREPANRPSGAPVDAEAVAVDRARGGVFVAFERPPSVVRLGVKSGQFRPVELPEGFASSLRGNRAFESVAVIDDGNHRREIWVAAENAPSGEPVATALQGQRCPVLVYDADRLLLRSMTVYETGPAPPGAGAFCALADWCALPDGTLLALEKLAPVGSGCDGVLYRVSRGGSEGGPLRKQRLGSLVELGITVRGVPEGVSVRPGPGGAMTVLVACDNNFAKGEHSDAANQLIVLRLGRNDRY